MTSPEPLEDEDDKINFVPLTTELLSDVERRVAEDNAAKKKQTALGDDGEKDIDADDEAYPDYYLEAGQTLPPRIKKRFPVALAGRPLKEIDPYYENKQTFIMINQCRTIYRFSVAKVLWLMDPLHPIRRIALSVIVHPVFRLIMNLIIIANCFMLVAKEDEAVYVAKRIFTSLYTIEFLLYVIAKGFVLHPFSYLRDPWHWFDLIILLLDYVHCSILPMKVYFGVLRAVRLLRLMGTTTLVPGVRNIVGSIYPSVLNARDAFILAVFPLILFALTGLQVYMGALTNKCIKDLPNVTMTDEEIVEYRENATNWLVDYQAVICGNASGSGECPRGYTCFEGYGTSPNYGYTNFDNYGWSLLTTFEVITVDFWEDVLWAVIKSAGPWHVVFFILSIFISRHIIYNLILIIITLSWMELQVKNQTERLAEEEDERIAAEKSIAHHEEAHEDNRVLDHTVTTPVLGEDDDKEWQRKKIPTNPILKFLQSICVWECCDCWKTFQKALQFVLYDAFTEVFLAVCVLLSTIFLALDHDGMTPEMHHCLAQGVWAFAIIFAIEVVLKIMASSPYNFFQEWRNIYEFVVLIFTIPALCVDDPYHIYVATNMLAILRAFRLFRIFRVAQAYQPMKYLFTVLRQCLFPFAVLTVLFFIITFIFAVLGMEFFGENYETYKHYFYGGETPRWNFVDFPHALMLVFRAWMSEWIESLWDCMLVNSHWLSIPFFLILAVLGHVLVFVLFFAVVYTEKNFAVCGNPETDLDIVAKRFKRFNGWIAQRMFGRNVATIIPSDLPQNGDANEMGKNVGKSMTSVELALEEVADGRTSTPKTEGVITVLSSEVVDDNEKSPSTSSLKNGAAEKKDASNGAGDGTSGKKDDDAEESDSDEWLCCPSFCYKLPSCFNDSVWRPWNRSRLLIRKLLEHKIYEIFMILCVLITIVAVALDDINIENNTSREKTIKCVIFAFEMIFLVEMLLKWFGLGLKRYFTNGWCWMEFIIIVVSLTIFISSCGGGRPLLKAFQSLRPLRLLPRFHGLRVTVNALISCLPTLLSVLIFCSAIWLVFSIIGVALFGGKFRKCFDKEGEIASEIANRTHCYVSEYTWEDSDVNFNHVGLGFLSLWFIATCKGWIEIVHNAVDSRHEVGLQPIQEGNLTMFLFIVIFTIVGCFFTFNLFACILITEFNRSKAKMGGSLMMFMTEEQKSYYEAIREMGKTKPHPGAPTFKFRAQEIVYNIISDKRFELTITICYTLNLTLYAFDYYLMDETFYTVLGVLDTAFIFVYIAEFLLKLFGLGLRYFRDPWNVFDFVVLLLIILRIIVGDHMAKYLISSPLFLRLIKAFRLGKVRSMLKGSRYTRGIRNLLSALSAAVPALFNIVLLHFVVTCVYALLGTCLFKNANYGGPMDDVINFGTFGRSFTIMFQLSTTAGWDGFIKPLMDEKNCNSNFYTKDAFEGTDCGNTAIAASFFISYLIIVFLIIIKLYTAVIFQNYNNMTELVQGSLTTDDYESFYDKWQKYDPTASQFIKYEDISDLLDDLEDPFRIRKPHKYKIVNWNLPIYEGNVLHCVDIMEALTKDFFERRGFDLPDDTGELRGTEKHGKKVISSTLMTQREECSAQVIQRTWNSYRNGKEEAEESSPVLPKSPGSNASASASQQNDPKLIEIAD